MIRSARDDDAPAIAAITNHYITTTAFHFAVEPLAVEDYRARWHAGQPRYPWLVAERTGAVVGYAKAGAWRDRGAYEWTTEVGLYVAPELRGGGIGRALYAELLGELACRGFRSAIAGITLPNEASLRLHHAFGFTSVGIVREAGYKLDAWHDVEFFQKRLLP
jgi:phosphinothricin acetyltransferase